ncbi:SEC-C metal-binding domain-containing protein, partial [Chloroflexota bacterium]
MSKIGRNDPCPCGSGKKYKKCCGITGDSKSGISEPNYFEINRD